jgi:competence protein ComEC
MLTIYATGIALGRKPDKYNTLSGAALCMLTYNPFYLFDIGFQLSFAAVFFILYLQPRISRLIEVRNPLLRVPWETLTVTVAAQTGVCFLCFFYFGKSSLVFLFTNLFLSMLALILVPTTLMWMNTPEWMPGWNLLRSAIEIMTRALMWTVDRFASLPGAAFALRFDFVTLIGSYIVLGLILLYFRSQRYNTLLAALIVLFAILCWHLLQDF